MARITIESLTKRFDDVVAVEDVNVDMEDGEFVVLVGPSGCGKTTTLRMIAGLETPSEGEIRFDEELINYRTPQNRDVAMVFQDYALYPHMTVRQNLAFGLKEEEEFTADERSERVEEVATLLDIDELLDRKPDELSGGQQQRVALGRAIVRDPEVFLMDEPLSNLDAKLRAQMRTELQQLQEQLGVTTVYVTHDQTEAMTMSDRMVVMNDGVIQQVGEPLELYHQPNNRFVAEFIGEPSMNFLDGRFSGDGFASDQLTYPFDERISEAVNKNVNRADESSRERDAPKPEQSSERSKGHDRQYEAGLLLGVRPEDVELYDGEPSDAPDERTVEMEVTVVEPMGNENVVHLSFSDGSSELVAIVDGMRSIDPETTVTVHLPAAAIHVFDPKSGEALHNRRLDHEEPTPRV